MIIVTSPKREDEGIDYMSCNVGTKDCSGEIMIVPDGQLRQVTASSVFTNVANPSERIAFE